MPKHRYNWRPDSVDARDFLYAEKVPKLRALPSQVDLRDRCSPIVNQGKIGSCTGNALAGAMEFLEVQELHLKGNQPKPEVFSGCFAHVSRLFIYFNERKLEGTTGEDHGARLRDGIKSLAEWGVCRESVWKYEPSLVLSEPSPGAYEEAKDHRISTYLRIGSFEDLKQCLASGFPAAFGFMVFESFETEEVARTGVVPLPEEGEQPIGGHAVLAVGYDDSNEMLWVRNSWGLEWGQRGYFQMPYAYVSNKKLAQDFWTIRK